MPSTKGLSKSEQIASLLKRLTEKAGGDKEKLHPDVRFNQDLLAVTT